MYRLFLIFLFFNSLFSQELKKVNLQLKDKYQFQFAGFIAAQEKGFYKEYGLDVQINELDNPNINIIQEVLKQKIDFAISDSTLIKEKLKGKDLKALMAIFQESPYVLLSLNNSTLNNLEDKIISINKNNTSASSLAILKTKNISYNIQSPLNSLKKLEKKEIDFALAYISNEVYKAKNKALNLNIINPKKYGFDEYSDILFTSNILLKKDPKTVESFYKASKKGWIYAFNNMDEIIDIIYKKYNTSSKTKNALKYEAKILKKLSSYKNNFGEIKEEKIKSIVQQLSFINNELIQKENLNNFIYTPNKKNIKVCYTTNVNPYLFKKDSKPYGLGIDILDLIEKNSDLKFEYIEAGINRDDLKLLKRKYCAISPIIVSNIKSHDFLNTTTPYAKDNFAYITRINEAHIDDLNNTKNKKIAFNKVYGNALRYIKKVYPNISFIKMDQHKAFEALINKDIDIYIDGFMALSYYIKQSYHGVLKVNNSMIDKDLKLSIAVHKDEAQLLEKINKILEKIPQEELNQVSNKWRYFDIKKEIDYTLILQVIIGTSILILFISYVYIREKKLKNKIEDLNKNLEKKVFLEVEKNKQKERLMLHQSRFAQMGEMLSMIAHQWRQPLNNLSVLNQTVILKYKLNKLDKEVIESFKKNSKIQIEQMSQTIDDFSNFFKPDKEKVDFVINDSVKQSVDILNAILEKHTIKVKIHEEEQLNVTSYKNEFNQAILNILNNAKDALIENNIENKQIDINLKKEKNTFVISVIDNAGGIPQNIIDRIFDPYFSTKDEKNGTGLGLYMTKIIIEEHIKAKINVDISKKGFTKFDILIKTN